MGLANFDVYPSPSFSRSCIFQSLFFIGPPFSGPANLAPPFNPKTRVLALFEGEDFVILAYVVFTQCQRVADRRMERDGQPGGSELCWRPVKIVGMSFTISIIITAVLFSPFVYVSHGRGASRQQQCILVLDGGSNNNYPAPGRYRERGIVFARFFSFCLFLCLFVSLFLCQQHYEKTAGPICMKFSGKVWSDHGTTWFNFGSIRVNGSPRKPPKNPNSPKWGSR